MVKLLTRMIFCRQQFKLVNGLKNKKVDAPKMDTERKFEKAGKSKKYFLVKNLVDQVIFDTRFKFFLLKKIIIYISFFYWF